MSLSVATVNCLVFAMRYALDRKTGADLQVVNGLKEHWYSLEFEDRYSIIDELVKAKAEGVWQGIIELDDRGPMKMYVTFGFGHEHTINGKNMNNTTVAVISCNSRFEGYDKVRELFGLNYFTVYLKPPRMNYFSGGLVEIDDV